MLLLAGAIHAEDGSSGTNTQSINRVLTIEPSSMSVAGGKATLTIGALQRVAAGYAGEYRINVFPYVYKNENGKLLILASDEALEQLAQGKITTITGTATTSGKKGRMRRIDATAAPVDADHGTLKLWFIAGDRKMVFEPSYRFRKQGEEK